MDIIWIILQINVYREQFWIARSIKEQIIIVLNVKMENILMVKLVKLIHRLIVVQLMIIKMQIFALFAKRIILDYNKQINVLRLRLLIIV